MRISLHERHKPHRGYQVRAYLENANHKEIAAELIGWLEERSIEIELQPYREILDIETVMSKYVKAINPTTFEHLIIFYLPTISDNDRMLLQLTFGGAS